jgi:hypothetical protein
MDAPFKMTLIINSDTMTTLIGVLKASRITSIHYNCSYYVLNVKRSVKSGLTRRTVTDALRVRPLLRKERLNSVFQWYITRTGNSLSDAAHASYECNGD